MGCEEAPPAGAGRNAGENVDQPADEPEERSLDGRRCAAEDEHGDEWHLRLADIEPDESERRARRLEIAARTEGINPGFEQAKDGAQEHGKRYRRIEGSGKGNE